MGMDPAVLHVELGLHRAGLGMRVVVIADVHCHQHEQFATTLPSGRNSRFQAILDVIGEVEIFCRKEEVDVLFVLGDVFHSRTKIDVDVYSATWCAFRDLCGAVNRAYILTGNHDQGSKDGRVHSLEAFRAFATVIDLPVIVRANSQLMFAAHPFTTDIDSWKTFIKMLPRDLDFCLFHQGVCEATVGAFDLSVKAEVSYTDLPLTKARWVLLGHFHKAQWLGEAQRAGFVGSPIQHNFGERLEEKGFLYFDGIDKRPQFVPTHGPRFVLYGTGAAFFDAFAQDAGDPCAPWNRGDYIRVTECTQDQAEAIKREFPQIQVEVVRQERFEENRISDAVVNSDEALLKAYIDKEAIDGMDHPRLLQFGMEILTNEE